MRDTKTVAIFAGGPSMTSEIADTIAATHVYSIAINNAWLLAPDADVLLAVDAAWWQEYPEALTFKGMKIVMQDQRIAGAQYRQPHPIGLGSNGALQAAHIAKDSGAAKVLLFGVDLREDELTHHHGSHRGNLSNPVAGTFRRARRAWEIYARHADRPRVINCSQRSALTCFPKMTIGEALGQ